jgi:hypothetical protein
MCCTSSCAFATGSSLMTGPVGTHGPAGANGAVPANEDPGTKNVEPPVVVTHWKSAVPHEIVVSLGGPPRLEPEPLGVSPPRRGVPPPSDEGPRKLVRAPLGDVPTENVPPPLGGVPGSPAPLGDVPTENVPPPLGGVPGSPAPLDEAPFGCGSIRAVVVTPARSDLPADSPTAFLSCTAMVRNPCRREELLSASSFSIGGRA